MKLRSDCLALARVMDLPWDYDLACGYCLPLGKRLVRLQDIAFTQKQVNDSFSHQLRPIMELIDSILSGEGHPRDIALIRVAWHDGQFWSIDNRRLFCYKHCMLERVLVEVHSWEEQHEFVMKWRNGQGARDSGSDGHRAGLVQRLPQAFPWSPVMNEKQNELCRLMDEESQLRHDQLREACRQRFWLEARKEDELARFGLQREWKFVVDISGKLFPATLKKALPDGTFDAYLWNDKNVPPSVQATAE